MLLGAHESAAGGCHRVFERCARDGAEAVQLWTRSSRQWASKPLEADAISEFKRQHAAYGKAKIPSAAHGSYLINLGSPKPEIWQRSTATLLEECERAEQLGIGQVIFHPGAAQGSEPTSALLLVCKALRQVCASLPTRSKVRILIEITAGQGSSLGCSFEQLAAILNETGEPRIGVCLDTQHMFAAGIDWTSEAGYEQTFTRFERLIGLRHLEAFHLNDSKKPLGSRVDRHAIIGDGLIGLAPFARLLRDARFKALPAYLETPPLDNGEDSYALGLSRLRSLLAD
jgi:deoxyribonuclease IV